MDEPKKVEACRVKHIFDDEELKKINRFLEIFIREGEPVFIGATPVYEFLKKLDKESLSEYKKKVLIEAINKTEKFAEIRHWSKWLSQHVYR